MPPHKKKPTPKDEFFEHGRQLLKDAENSTNPKFAKLRAKAAKRYFDADVKGGARISTGLALAVGLPIILLLAGICIYAAIKLSTAVVWFVLIACIAFALIIMLLLLALTGLMGDTLVAKVMLGIFDKLIAAYRKGKSNGS
jgi:hypothetical protein